MNFVRYPFFFVNTLFMVLGILIMSYGILLLTNYSVLEDMLQANRNLNFSESIYRSDVPVLLQKSPMPRLRWLTRIRDPASYLMIAFGATFFTLSFIGYCGSVKDSRGLMVIYGVLLGLIIVCQVVGVVLYLKYKPDLKMEMTNAVNTQYKSEEMRKFTQFEFILDLLMVNYKCCGVNNERDFKEAYSHFYSVRSLPIDPRNQVDTHQPYYRVTVPSSFVPGEYEMEKVDVTTLQPSDADDTATPEEDLESRVVTGQEETMERQVPVTCCKLNITSGEAVRLLRNIYRKQHDKLQLLNYAIDEKCVTEPDEFNAYVGDSHGCFDKIHGEISTFLRVGIIVLGMIELCALVFAFVIFKTAYYDWLG